MTLTRTEVRDLLDRFDLRPKRSLGQNFVVEPNTVRRIAELSGVGPGDRVVEVGPGVGALTLALLETGAEVTAVEIDDRLVEVLGEVVGGRFDQLGAFRLVHADAMAVDWGELLGEGPWTLVANLPYNVSVPLVCDLLDEVPAITRMVVMVQLEVAGRLVAGHHRKGGGVVTVDEVQVAAAHPAGRGANHHLVEHRVVQADVLDGQVADAVQDGRPHAGNPVDPVTPPVHGTGRWYVPAP